MKPSETKAIEEAYNKVCIEIRKDLGVGPVTPEEGTKALMSDNKEVRRYAHEAATFSGKVRRARAIVESSCEDAELKANLLLILEEPEKFPFPETE